MQTKPFDFTGAAGQKLAGRLDLPDQPPRGYALFAHCFTCTKNSLAAVRIARALTGRGFGVLRFDFTGLGGSGGRFADGGLSGDISDLLAAVEHMTRAGMPPRLMIGHSLGGAAVLAAAAELPELAAVATIAAPFDVQHVTGLFKGGLEAILVKGEAEVDLGGRPFTIRRSFIDDLRQHDQGARIARLRHPLLVLHSPTDQTVGVENASSIFLAAKHPKSYVSLDNADHLLTREADAIYAAEVIAAWASRYLDAAAAEETLDRVQEQVLVRETRMGKLQVEVAIGKTRFYADEPVSAGGLGSGPSPYDLLCAALGTCTCMTVRLYADHKQWPLQRISATVGHEKHKDRTPADLFTRTVTLEGPLDEAQRARLMEIAGKCPVHRTLESGSAIVTAETHTTDVPARAAS
ncbi:MAG TPA: alpha/beta fold hydrolase [Candidatus Cybelea sp.]|nr:alpha/beta fold hydrolase [Candidatus Cybelea sp.]